MTSEVQHPRCGREGALTASRDQLDNLLDEAMERNWRINTYGEDR